MICIYLFLQDDWQSKIWGSTATTHSWLSWQFWSNTSCVVICNQLYFIWIYYYNIIRGGRGRMVVGFITTYAISSYHHWRCEFKSCFRRGVLDTPLFDQVCLWLWTGWWFSPVSSTNKTDRHDITEILLKVALNIIKQTNKNPSMCDGLKQGRHHYHIIECNLFLPLHGWKNGLSDV